MTGWAGCFRPAARRGSPQFLYDGDALVAEYSESSGPMLRRYVHGSGMDEPLIWYEGAAATPATARHLKANHQGSIVALTDANGYNLAINSYDEYGIPSARNMGRFQYTGQAWIPELGMYHYKARIEACASETIWHVPACACSPRAPSRTRLS